MLGRKRLVALLSLSLISASLTAQAEMYVGGQVGWSFPNDFTNVEGTKNLTGIGLSDLKLQNNLIYGAKLGYFFESLKWFGVETEVFNATPHQKQQTTTVTAPGVSVPVDVEGSLIRVTTWAFNAVLRYPGEQFQPYIGAGVGVFFAHTDGASDTAIGFNGLAGAKYFFTKNVAAFAEYKYQRASLEFAGNVPGFGPTGIKGDYSANSIVGGVAYHFDALK
jgi:opacity protein-like surface antigen